MLLHSDCRVVLIEVASESSIFFIAQRRGYLCTCLLSWFGQVDHQTCFLLEGGWISIRLLASLQVRINLVAIGILSFVMSLSFGMEIRYVAF